MTTVDYEIARDAGPALPVRATWTAGTGSLPVIVFSHGMGGSRDGYDPLVEAWAAHGYLVLQPTHPDSLAFRSRSERLRLLRDPHGFVTDSANLAAWDDRPVEVALLLDHLDELGAAGLDVSRIDREHVGIGGHSFGAHTAMLCGGLTFAGSRAWTEPRADAILLLSPQGTGDGITADSYASIALPTMVVTGSNDVSRGNGKGADWRLEAWTGLQTTDRWLLFLDGATHALGGISRGWPGAGAKDPAMVDTVIDATTAFWDAALRGDPAARARLDAEAVRPARTGDR